MRSSGKHFIVLALAMALLSAAPRAQSSHAAELFQQARSREADLRKELDSGAGASTTPMLTRMRTLTHTFEDLWRLFPTSPYSDDALWHGAMLAADAFRLSGEAADRATSLRLFQALTRNFPTSSLIKQVPLQVARLEAAKPSDASARAATPATASPPAVAPTPLPIAILPAPRAGATAPAGYATLTAIRREVLPDVLRVTLELEREPEFISERIDGPPRVFIDMQNTRASDALKDANLPFKDDIVRQIRVGRQLNGRIRVVLDLSGAGKHSVYALYDPFRIVIDFERKTPSIAGVQQAAAPPHVVQPAPAVAPPVRSASTPPAVVAAPAAVSTAVATAPQPRPVPADTGKPEGRPLPISQVPTPQAPRAQAATAPAQSTPATSPRPTTTRGPEPGDSFTPPAAQPAASMTPAAPPLPPATNSTGSFSLSRQLGLGIGRIVIDPGHGGHDPGAQATGLSEADVTLDVALRLEKLFAKSGVEVILTRRDNSFVPLQERTAIANRAGADLFLSIHVNANDDAALRGVETYFLNISPNPEAGRIAARENASSSKTMHDFQDIVKAIALNDKIDESREFAATVQTSMFEKLLAANREMRNLGVKQAPFMVLIGATMPSILAEISFLTNRQDAALLKTDKYRQQIADALFQGVMRYQQALKKVPAVARQDTTGRPNN